jgi:hypothetical protein
MNKISILLVALALPVPAAMLTSTPVPAIELSVVPSMVGSNATRVINRCGIWVSKCLKRFGPRSPEYGQCLRNHGCG